MKNNEIETHPFEPFLPSGARVLMLGTFPPKPERWSMEFYYPNKINDMWRIMGLVFYGDKDRFWNADSKKFILEDIKRFLAARGIALYDTGAKVRRLKDNASDKFLEIVECADVKSFLTQYPTLTAIFTAGEKASQVLADIFGYEPPKVGESKDFAFENRRISHYRLPSSSRAYPLALEKKAAVYARIFKLVGYDVILEKNI